MKKYILTFILSFIIGQNFIPSNDIVLNQTQVFFKWPQINKSIYYKIYISDNQNFYESYSNSIIINDFEWGSHYSWYVCGINQSNQIIDCYDQLDFSINSLPEDYPNNVNILEFQESDYQEGITLLDYESLNYSVALDKSAQPVWFSDNSNFFGERILAIQFLLNGNIVGFAPGVGYELDLDSDIIFETPDSYDLHHSIHKTNRDTYFFIDAEIQAHPCPQECDPEYPDIISWQGDRFIEVDQEGNVIWEWSTFDYLSLDEYNPKWVDLWMSQWDFGGNPNFDWTHSNSVYYDEDLDIVYISIRNLSRITAIDYSTKEILWNLGNPDFMEEVFFDNSFDFSHQHSAQVTNQKNILFFDNGRDNIPELSRCVEIEIDNNIENAEFIWEHVLPIEMATLSRGECDRLENGNTLISAGRTGNVVEVNNDNRVVWHLSVKENNNIPITIYRSERIYNLYPNIFSFKINDLFGTFNDNYHIDYNDDEVEFEIYNKGWSKQDFVYQILNSNEDILYTSQVNIPSFSSQNINISIDSSIEEFYLKVYSLNKPSNYQIINFDNNFILGDLNDDFELNIQDIVLIVNYILFDQDYTENADLNQDYGINILDIIQIINLIL
tara:strand:- start:72 stop:1904 length:1833 start_codon:yes stop_codon:yes gene_type:complete